MSEKEKKTELSYYQQRRIAEHNRKMEIINHTSKVHGLSPALLFYCARFGMIGMPWVAPETPA